jgi:hypothetical protein
VASLEGGSLPCFKFLHKLDLGGNQLRGLGSV